MCTKTDSESTEISPGCEWLTTFKVARKGTLFAMWQDDPRGLYIAGHSIPELLEKLPHAYAELEEARNG